VVEQDKELEEELTPEVGVGNLIRDISLVPSTDKSKQTSRSTRSGLVKNLAKKYSVTCVSSVSGSRFRFSDAAPAALVLLPIMARSLAVASLMRGKTLLTASLNCGNVSGLVNIGGFENGS